MAGPQDPGSRKRHVLSRRLPDFILLTAGFTLNLLIAGAHAGDLQTSIKPIWSNRGKTATLVAPISVSGVRGYKIVLDRETTRGIGRADTSVFQRFKIFLRPEAAGPTALLPGDTEVPVLVGRNLVCLTRMAGIDAAASAGFRAAIVGGGLDEAMRISLSASRADPGWRVATAFIDALAADSGGSAARVFLEISPSDFPSEWRRIVAMNRALSLSEAGRSFDAGPAFDAAFAEGSSWPKDIFVAGALAFIRVNDFDTGLALLRKSLISHPDDPELHVLVALVLMELGDLTAASESLDSAAASASGSYVPRYLRAALRANEREWTAALIEIDAARTIAENSGASSDELGQIEATRRTIESASSGEAR